MSIASILLTVWSTKKSPSPETREGQQISERCTSLRALQPGSTVAVLCRLVVALPHPLSNCQVMPATILDAGRSAVVVQGLDGMLALGFRSHLQLVHAP